MARTLMGKCAEIFSLVLMWGRAEGQMFADTGANVMYVCSFVLSIKPPQASPPDTTKSGLQIYENRHCCSICKTACTTVFIQKELFCLNCKGYLFPCLLHSSTYFCLCLTSLKHFLHLNHFLQLKINLNFALTSEIL